MRTFGTSEGDCVTQVFTVDDLKAVVENFDVELVPGLYGFNDICPGGGCVLSMVFLHHTQSLDAVAYIYHKAVRVKGISVVRYVAENTGFDLQYLRGLESGFEMPNIPSIGSEQFNLGNQHGIIIRKYRDEQLIHD